MSVEDVWVDSVVFNWSSAIKLGQDLSLYVPKSRVVIMGFCKSKDRRLIPLRNREGIVGNFLLSSAIE